ncbi:hypothetical protein Tco_0805956, partial [Tanacetum coccineum]
FSDGNPPTPPSLKGLFKVVDVPNTFDEKIGMLGSSNPHHHETKQDLGKWASSIADFVSNQDISLPDLETVMDVLDEMGFTYSIEVYLLRVALLKVYEVVSKSNLDIPPHIKDRLMRLMRLMRLVNVRSSESMDSSVKVFEERVEVYVDAPGFLKEHFQVIVERHQNFEFSSPTSYYVLDVVIKLKDKEDLAFN